MLVLLPLAALAGAPGEISVSAGKSMSPFTAELPSDQRFGGLAARVPVAGRGFVELRGAAFVRPTIDELQLAVDITAMGDLMGPRFLEVPLAMWSGSVTVGWIPFAGQVSLADEAILDVELRVSGGAAMHRGTFRSVVYGSGVEGGLVLDWSTYTVLEDAEGAWTSGGPVAAVTGRVWATSRLAVDLEWRETVSRGPVTALEATRRRDPAPIAWRDHGALGLSLTSLWGGRRAPDPASRP
jgi:hypothetical protein